ncbi:helix-turn-helix domain-containing protein [Mycolicibacterium conceptionense]|uniref:helix-turn-helix domain-containing protein n=1 Tax=Mycolicibacterium TaxID=1866885 RepID=UPI00148FE3CF|nr:helix-turn-helix domain-containing protein [Mycolicibacterium fortuitum]
MSTTLAALNATDARALTDRIKVGVEAVWELIKQAYTERAWDALGYSSWDDYCTREFGTSRLRLPREERAEVVSSLRESGLSLRAIASATGDSVTTVRRELAGVPNGTPADLEPVASEQELPPLPENYMSLNSGDHFREDAQEEWEPEPAAEQPVAPKPITGTDGKTYNPKPAAPQTPKRKPLPEAFDRAKQELRTAVERVVRLSGDDRLEKNKDQITGANLSDLIRARDALNDVIQQLEG